MMAWLGWSRLPRAQGVLPSQCRRVVAYAFPFLLALAALFTIHMGLCVVGSWGCVGAMDEERPAAVVVPGQGSLLQLRRNVAHTLLQLARDLRLGHTASVITQLEVTATLLDPRYQSRARGPPAPHRGDTPPPLVVAPSSTPPQPAAAGPSTTSAAGSQLSNTTNKPNTWLKAPGSEDVPQVSKEASAVFKVQDNGTGSQEDTEDLADPEYPGNESTLLETLSPINSSENPDSLLPGWAELRDLGEEPLPPLASQVTVVVDGCSASPPHLVAVVRQARSLWPRLKLRLTLDEERQAEVADIAHLPNVTLIAVECVKWRRSDLRLLTRAVTTPFVLVLDGVSAITQDLDLSRLLSVAMGLRSLGVAVVGGAERGRDGVWDYTCTRLDLFNARLTLRDGYDFSLAACLFCDITSRSFLAVTEVINQVPFDLNMVHRSQDIDWSLRVMKRGFLTMTCPDVMFHVHRNVRVRDQHREPDNTCVTREDRKVARARLWAAKRQYRRLAQKWVLNVITFSNGTTFEYSCREIHYDCKARQSVKHYMLPPCCLKTKNRILNTIDIIAKENRVPYYIYAGTLLGALKFKDGIPWDFDDDMHFSNANIDVFARNTLRMKRLGLTTALRKQVNKVNKTLVNKYIEGYTSAGFSVDMWGLPSSLSSLATLSTLATIPDNLVCFHNGHVPTPIKVAKSILKNGTQSRAKKRVAPSCYLHSIVRVGTNWVPAPWNPGKTSLNHYGDNLYRHEAHWRWYNIKEPGWKPCPRPGHHTCLDLHPLDGSLPFL